jgi:hypothetical protein
MSTPSEPFFLILIRYKRRGIHISVPSTAGWREPVFYQLCYPYYIMIDLNPN